MVRCSKTRRKVRPPWSSRSRGVFSSLTRNRSTHFTNLYLICSRKNLIVQSMFNLPSAKYSLCLLFNVLKIKIS